MAPRARALKLLRQVLSHLHALAHHRQQRPLLRYQRRLARYPVVQSAPDDPRLRSVFENDFLSAAEAPPGSVLMSALNWRTATPTALRPSSRLVVTAARLRLRTLSPCVGGCPRLRGDPPLMRPGLSSTCPINHHFRREPEGVRTCTVTTQQPVSPCAAWASAHAAAV